MNFVLLFVVALLGTTSLADDKTPQYNATSVFSSIEHARDHLNEFTNQQLAKSYDFLLLSAVFDQYNLDRSGFEKLYRKISDKAWEDTIDLIKYRTKRGLSVDVADADNLNDIKNNDCKTKSQLLKSNEIDSLKLALGYEKHLAEESHKMHKDISHAHADHNARRYDPDVAHYLDEHIIEYQSGRIRKLSGYIHNLDDILGEAATKDLGLRLFDEYLDKVE